MVGKNLKALLEDARQAMKDNSPSDCFLQLKESLRDDFYWEAMSFEIKGPDLDNIEEIKTIGYGQTPEEALNELIGKLSMERQTIDQHKQMYNDKLWTEIMEKTDIEQKIELFELRTILEKYKILADEKNGM